MRSKARFTVESKSQRLINKLSHLLCHFLSLCGSKYGNGGNPLWYVYCCSLLILTSYYKVPKDLLSLSPMYYLVFFNDALISINSGIYTLSKVQ